MAKKMICTICGSTAKTKTIVKGSFLIEIVLWLCFIVPGLIYSLWRSTSLARTKVCGSCNSPHIIPVDSPNGKILLNKSNGDYQK